MPSPTMQPSYAPHHKSPVSPHMGSATSPNMNANQNNSGNWPNNQYYRPSQYYSSNSYSMPMPSYGGQAFVPQLTVNRAIPIINPNTSEVINLSNQSANKELTTAASSKTDEPPKEMKDFKINTAPSRAIKIVNPKEKEEESERKAKEEAERKAKEEAEQRAREEAEKKAKEEAEQMAKKEQKAKEEAELKAKEEAERKLKEEAELKAKKEAELKAKEEAEQRAKEEAEQKAKEKAEQKAKEEAEQKAKEEAEQKAKEEAEQKAKEEAEQKAKEEAARREQEKKAKEEADAKAAKEAKKIEESKAQEAKTIEGDKVDEAKTEEAKYGESKTTSDKGVKEEERIATITANKAARGLAPGRLDMSAIPSHVFHDSPVSTPTGLTPTKVKGPPMPVIEDFSSIEYPPEFLAPSARDPVSGKISYEPAFLMQFQKLCLESDEDLSQFQSMNEESGGNDNNRRSMSRRQTSDRGRGPRTPGGSGDGMYRNNSRDGRGEMGKFSGGRQISHRQGSNGPNSPGMERQGSHGGRNRSSRGGKGRHPPREQPGGPTIPLEQVVPLEKSENRWMPAVVATDGVTANASDKAESENVEMVAQEVVIRKVKSLLNKLTLEKFDSISDQILEFAKQSEKEDDGKSLKTVIQLVFDKACDEPNFASMWAQLCKKMYDTISHDNKIKDVNILDKNKQVVSGGPLYRKYLLNRCQEGFERGWKIDAASFDESSPDVMMTDEYYAMVKAKRQGLGLVQFIGELYKLHMLTDQVLMTCLMKLCADPSHPEDEETESMCKLLTTMGKVFDTSSEKNRQWLDVYFARMEEMYKSNILSSRVNFLILDVLDLRKNRWASKRANQPAPTTIAEIHEQAKKANVEKEKETMKRSGSSRGGNSPHPMSRQSSRGGRDIQRQNSSRNSNNNPNQDNQSGGNTPTSSTDGWNTVGTSSPTSGPRSGRMNELANFGKTDRSKSRNNVLGPSSSPFSSLARSGSKSNLDKKAASADNRASSPATSMANMFSALGDEGEEPHSGERKKLQLLPRSSTGHESEEGEKKEESPAPATSEKKLSDEIVKRKSKNIIEEYFSLRDKKELLECVKELDHTDYRVVFAGKLLDVVERKTQDVDVACEIITELSKERIVSREEYILAFKSFWEGYEDLIIDVPKAPEHVNRLLAATGIERSEVEAESV
ncbi:armadillo-type protein [Parasitella parasitica]|nr:armadillo-type protein [Parasitella parasitica]